VDEEVVGDGSPRSVVENAGRTLSLQRTRLLFTSSTELADEGRASIETHRCSSSLSSSLSSLSWWWPSSSSK
jgi:hypothetical protein